ncbi:MAG: EAL domain-containing protein [Campylobacterota bacterium]|nr:EAL domain-containing protein [Campylobacterota bacterium]
MRLFQIKKIDSITAILWVLIFFIIILFGYLTQVSKHINHYSNYNDTINKLKILDKEFESFLLTQAVFINYDIINKSISKFNTNLEFLSSQESLVTHPFHYHSLVKKVQGLYKDKLSYIEYYKSHNTQVLYSMHYLFDLNMVISNSKELNKETKELASKTLLHLMKYYINATINDEYIQNNLQELNILTKENVSVKTFSSHILINAQRIQKFNEMKKINESESLYTVLESLDLFLYNDYQKNIFIEKTIVGVLFIATLLILLTLIFMNRRAIALREELLGFKTAIENSYNSIVITDIDSNITYVNDIAIEDTGYTKKELIGQNPRVLKSGLNDESFYKEMHIALDKGEKWEGDFINKKKDGSLFYEKASIMPIFKNGELVNYLAVKLNITDYIEEKHKVEYMAYHDSLTSLPNRLSIEEYLGNRLPIAKRSGSKIAILFIDLDRFKTINDTLGHDVGDELLIESAKRMRKGLRDSDMLARVGGDEFVIVIESPSSDYSAAHVCEKILQLFAKPIQTQKHLLSISLSIGVSVYPDDHTNFKQLFKYADIAMYEAKDAGKNTYRYYQKELSVEAHIRLGMEQNLKSALQNSEIYMMYQPKYSIIDRRVVGFEALVRWKSATLGDVPPDKFIPIAEDTGFIIEMGLFIFEQSCRDFLELKKHSKSIQTVSINISAVQLYQESFIEDIIKIVQDVGINTKSIVLEITETHIMKNIQQSSQVLKELRELEFNISIDDFGTGHSSLSYLKLFPINELKIDKTFIDDLPHDKNDVAISKSIITLSKAMGYVNVAEGIENEAQEQFLKENNCSIGQGYYFCRPKIKDDFIKFLKEKNENR